MRSLGVVEQVIGSGWESGWDVSVCVRWGGGCGERPSGCVCKAKRPAVGAHLLTISPQRVALHTLCTHTFLLYRAHMRNDSFTIGWSC